MIKLYSWREGEVVTMLDEDEWSKVEPYAYDSIKQIKSYRAEAGCTLREAKLHIETKIEKIFFEITGEKLPSYENIFFRRRADYGVICLSCNKPYRTNKASFCVECGHKN